MQSLQEFLTQKKCHTSQSSLYHRLEVGKFIIHCEVLCLVCVSPGPSTTAIIDPCDEWKGSCTICQIFGRFIPCHVVDCPRKYFCCQLLKANIKCFVSYLVNRIFLQQYTFCSYFSPVFLQGPNDIPLSMTFFASPSYIIFQNKLLPWQVISFQF